MGRTITTVVALWLATAVAHAQATQNENRAKASALHCAASFGERAADARRAVLEYQAFMKEYEKAKPDVEWFDAHCRFLSELEVAIRKLDDPNSFVCDTQKGRPKNLTFELYTRFSVLPTVAMFQDDKHSEADARCAEQDKARMVLVPPVDVNGEHKRELVAYQLLLLCYGDDGERCSKVRAMLSAQDASTSR